MRKHLLVSFFLVLLIAVTTIACSQNIEERLLGKIVFNMEDYTKTIEPEQRMIKCSSYKANGKNGEHEFGKSFTGKSTSVELITGTWEIWVEGFNADGDKIAESEKQTITVEAGTTAQASTFMLEYEKDGTGTLNLTVNVDVEAGVSSVGISIGEMTETITSYTDSDGSREFVYTTSLDVGEYNVKVVMKDSDGNTVGCPNIEIAHVFSNLTSSKTWENALAAAKPEITVNGTEVTITTATKNEGTKILYTTDESDPGKSRTAIVYSKPFRVSKNTIVKAVTVHPDLFASSVAQAEVKIQASKPTFSKETGGYRDSFNVEISAQSGSIIYYTTDGTTPTESSSVYSEPIKVDRSMTIKAFARATGYDDSEVAEATYEIVVYEPVLTKNQGTNPTVSLSTSTTDAVIRYTTDGTTPTDSSAVYSTPIAIPTDETLNLKAFASREGCTSSKIVTWKVSIDKGTGEIVVEDPENLTLSIKAPDTLTRTGKISRDDENPVFEAVFSGGEPEQASYQWYINSYMLEGFTAKTFTLDLSEPSLGKNIISVQAVANGKTYYSEFAFTLTDYAGYENEYYGFWKGNISIQTSQIEIGMMLYPESKSSSAGKIIPVFLNDQGLWSADIRNSGTYGFTKNTDGSAKINFVGALPMNTDVFQDTDYILTNVTVNGDTMNVPKMVIKGTDATGGQDLTFTSITFTRALNDIGTGPSDRNFWTELSHYNYTKVAGDPEMHSHKYKAVSGEYTFERSGLTRHSEEKTIVGFDKYWECDYCGNKYVNRKKPVDAVLSDTQLWNLYGSWNFAVTGKSETGETATTDMNAFIYPDENSSTNGDIILFAMEKTSETDTGTMGGFKSTYTITGNSDSEYVIAFTWADLDGTGDVFNWTIKNITYVSSGEFTGDVYASKGTQTAITEGVTFKRNNRDIGISSYDEDRFVYFGCGVNPETKVHYAGIQYRGGIGIDEVYYEPVFYAVTDKKYQGNLLYACTYCGQELNQDGTEYYSETTSADFEYEDQGKTVCGLKEELKGTKSSIIIPDGVTTIKGSAFAADSYISNVYIPASVTTIGNRAFRNCDITKLEFEERQSQNELIIEDRAFFANNLTNINLPEGVKSIGERTFKRAGYLESNLCVIYLPSTLESIGRYAFGSFGSTNFYFGGSIADWDNVKKELAWNAWCEDGTIKCSDGDAYVYEYYTLEGQNDDVLFGKITDACRNHKEDKFLEVDSSAIGIGELAFVDGSNLNSILFHSSVTSIGKKVFKGSGSPNVYYNGTLAQFGAIILHSDWKGDGNPTFVVCQDDGKLMGLWKGELVDTSGADCGEYIFAIGRVLSFSESGASLGDGQLLIKTNVLSDGVAQNPGFDYASSAASVASKEGGYSATIKSMAIGQGQTADMPVSLSSDANTMTIDKTVVYKLLGGSYQDLVLTRQ